MKIGYAKRDVTPPIGVRLGGYGHRMGKPSEMVHDPLFASALLIESSGDSLLFLHGDVLGVYKDFADSVKRRIHSGIGIEPGRIFFTTTHTHSGPETIVPMWPNTFPYDEQEARILSDWEAAFAEAIVEASVEANERALGGSISLGTSRAPDLTLNRTYKNNVIDDQIPFMILSNGVQKVIVANYCCHPVCNTDSGISSDYPGALYAELDKLGFNCFFTTGPAGDVDPLGKGREFIANMGSQLCSAIVRESGNTYRVKEDVIGAERSKISLKMRNSKGLRQARARFKGIMEDCQKKPDDAKCLSRLIYADEEYEVAKDRKTSVQTLIQLAKIGKDIVFISIPGELFVEFGLQIKALATKMGYRSTFVSTYSEDYVGYIPDKMAFKIHSYEATLARWSRLTPEAGSSIMRELTNSLKQ